jgi:hypothetical protein
MKIIEAMIDHSVSWPEFETDDLLSDVAITIYNAITDVIGDSAFVLDANGEKKDVDLAKLNKAIADGVGCDITAYARDPVATHAEPSHLSKIGTFESIARQMDLNGWLTGHIVVIVREEDFKALQQKADTYDKLRGQFIELVDESIESINDAKNAIRVAREMVGA